MPSDYVVARGRALQQFEGAYHLVYRTFPLVRDPKLLLGAIDNLAQSLEHSMESVLSYERELRLIPAFLPSFQSKLNAFQIRSMKRNKIPKDFVKTLLHLKDILVLHKQSPMVFQRGNKLVICSPGYQMQTISLKTLKEYIDQTKEYLDLIDSVIKIDRKT